QRENINIIIQNFFFLSFFLEMNQTLSLICLLVQLLSISQRIDIEFTLNTNVKGSIVYTNPDFLSVSLSICADHDTPNIGSSTIYLSSSSSSSSSILSSSLSSSSSSILSSSSFRSS